MTTIFSIKDKNYADLIEKAAISLQNGSVVAFPTETVYGLGANAFNSKAVDQIFEIKGRPSDNPIIVHLENFNKIHQVANIKELKRLDLYKKIELLNNHFWPGPLTLIIPKSEKIPLNVTANLDTVAVRVPSHMVALDLLKATSFPIAAPSANISGLPSPTTVEDVIEDIYGRIPFIIDGGSCEIGLESTVLDLSENIPKILRPGVITLEDLQEILGKVELNDELTETIKSPGQKYPHYSPKAEVKVIQGSKKNVYSKIIELISDFHKKNLKVGIIISDFQANFDAEYVYIYGNSNKSDLKYFGSILFHQFRVMDRKNINIIIIEGVEEKGIGLAIMNRLKKSAKNHVIYV